jgi:translation initiation factor 4B
MTHEWRRTGPLPPLASEQPRRVYEEGGREGGRRQSSFEGDGRVRDFGNWERKGPLSPLSPTSEHGGRPRGDREFRRRSPAPSADGDRQGGFRERPAVSREPSAAEKDNEWRRGARPDASQRSQPASPILPHTRPKLELKKRSEQPVETTPTSSSDKPNPFGGARPIDTTQREKEIEERRAATVAARKAEEEKVRDEKKAARPVDASDKGSDAGTPTAGKNFDVLRRVSAAGSDQGMATDVPEAVEEVIEEPQEKLQEKPQEKKKVERVEKPQTKGPDNWRARAQVKSASTTTPTETDGWSTVGPKRGSRSGSKSVPAS